jgi:hypothetical protein
VLPGQAGRGGLDRAVVAELGDQVIEQRRDVGPGRVADEDGFPGQSGEVVPADVVEDGSVRQHLGTVFGHSLLQGTPGVAVRVDDMPIPFGHEGPPRGICSTATVTLKDNCLPAQRRKSLR